MTIFRILFWLSLILLACVPRAFGKTVAPDIEGALQRSQAVVGSQLADYELLRADGETLRLSRFRGKPLLVQFIYTSCSQACPVSVKYLEKGIGAAREVLGADAFSVVTIGFNLPFDTPQAMSAFAQRHGISDSHWYFVAGNQHTIDEMTRALGFSWYSTPKGFDHIAQVSIVDAKGRIYRQVYGEQIDVPSLVDPLKQLVTGQQQGAGDWRAFLERVRLFCTIYDSSSGRYRLDYSLFLEIFIGATVLGGAGLILAGEWRKSRRGGR